jgi:putative ABC transport system permease protein
MWKVTWRNLFARKLRLALSGFAIVLGVAFVSGSFIFTDAMGGAFAGIIKGSTADVEIAPAGVGDFDSAPDARTIPASLVPKLEKLPEAGSVHPFNQVQSLYVIGKSGKLVGGNGPPGLGYSDTDTRAITGKPVVQYVDGHHPHGTGEIALDVDTAKKAHYSLGDTVTLVTPGTPPKIEVKLVGLVNFGEGSLAGATLTLFDPHAMQQLFFGGRDAYSGISLNTAPGVSQEQLRDAAAPLLPHGVTARTGDAVAKAGQASLEKVLGFLNTFLLVFAAIAMIVGTFLIVNTFSILVAQRSRELALLRAMGASRRQVNRSVLAEAFVVGVVGSTLGLGAGYLLALGLRALFSLIGLDLSGASFPVMPRTVGVSYAVGVIVTMIAAYLPARRAARIPPVAAMRDDVALPEASLHRRLLVGTAMIAVGIVLMVIGLAVAGSKGLLVAGIGMLLILIGVSLMSPVIGRPLVHGLGAVYRRLFGTVGVLASQNATRNPRRTAATASALMIGLTLVALMSILGQSATASTDKAIKATLTSQFVISNAIGTPFSPGVAKQVRGVDGVDAVAEFRQAFPKVDGKGASVAAADPQQLAKALRFPMVAGALEALKPGTTIVDAKTAQTRRLHVGDTVKMKFQAGVVPVKVVGVFGGGGVPADFLVTFDTLTKGGLAPLDSLVFITKKDSASTAHIRTAVEKITKDLPTVTLKDPNQFAEAQKSQIDFFLNVIYALLGLAVVIAILGIVNTLALSVIERTREIGLLRAVGLSRRQLRRMVRLESVIVAVLGAVLGVGMGLIFGVALQRAVADQGIDVLSIPWARLVIFVVLAAVVGVLAAVLPARRAAKLDVLRAISTE